MEIDFDALYTLIDGVTLNSPHKGVVVPSKVGVIPVAGDSPEQPFSHVLVYGPGVKPWAYFWTKVSNLKLFSSDRTVLPKVYSDTGVVHRE